MAIFTNLWRRGLFAAVVAVCTTALAAGGARAGETPVCPSSTGDAYTLAATALTGPSATDVSLHLGAAAGCAAVTSVKHVQIKIYDADGKLVDVSNLHDEALVDGTPIATLPRVDRGLRIEVDGEVQTGTPPRTYVVRDATTSKLRPDLVVTAVHAPAHVLLGKPFDVTVQVTEKNGDTGATAHVTLGDPLGRLGDPLGVTVMAGDAATVTFTAVKLGAAVPTDLTLDVQDAAPAEYDATNGARHAAVDVTKNELTSPRVVLFPALLGYGAQFNNHLYAPITQKSGKMPPGATDDVVTKVKALEPQLVRVFYNDNWEANADGTHGSDYLDNYKSFVNVVGLAQETGATIDISFQNLANELPTRKPAPIPVATAMHTFADVLQDLVVNHEFTNVRWAEVGNEPNSGLVSLDQYKALYQALNDELVARGLRGQIQLMGGGLVENHSKTDPTLARDHYSWMSWILQNMGGLVDGVAEHVYWNYDDSGRLEYRLRDTYHLMNDPAWVAPGAQKPLYMMEYGIRGLGTCDGKTPAANTYYAADPSCPEIWRTNIAGFQQFWFDIAAAQLGVAGTSKWDAYWAIYDRTLNPPQVYWMTGPATEGYPLTPTYNAMSLLFHTTVPGWQIVQLAPWQDDDWQLAEDQYRQEGHSAIDQPEQELVAYAGPSGELTVVGLDTNGKALNAASTDPPSRYSIAGLPPNAQFTLAVWNATGDGTNSIAGTVTTNDVGVARFDVPLQAAFALTNVPVA